MKDARAIVGELKKFSADLAKKPRWLLLNKSNLLPPEEAEKRAKDIVRRLRFRGPHFLISGVTGAGTAELVQAASELADARQVGVVRCVVSHSELLGSNRGRSL